MANEIADETAVNATKEGAAGAKADIWEGDTLDRQADAQYLFTFLRNKIEVRRSRGESASFVLNLNARWGDGKTFFLERFCEQVRNNGHLCCYVNAWRDDHSEDPLIALMAGVDEILKDHVPSNPLAAKAWRLTKKSGTAVAAKVGIGIADKLTQRFVGAGLGELYDLATSDTDESGESVADELKEVSATAGAGLSKILDESAEKLIESFQKQSRSIEKFKAELSNTVKYLGDKFGKPMFILVDELDRCRPDYAVKLLERVKHLFQTDYVVFVIATDTDQLQHSVQGLYGAGFDGLQYLKRFFDQTYTFEFPDVNQFTAMQSYRFDERKIAYADETVEDFLISVYNAWRPDFRSFLQWIDHCENVITVWEGPSKIDLAILFVYVITFHKSGNFERLSKPIRAWHSSSSERTASGLEKIDLSSIASNVIAAASDVNSFFNSAGGGFNSRYIGDLFTPEFNGAVPPRGTKSKLSRIQFMVQNAGRLAG